VADIAMIMMDVYIRSRKRVVHGFEVANDITHPVHQVNGGGIVLLGLAVTVPGHGQRATYDKQSFHFL